MKKRKAKAKKAAPEQDQAWFEQQVAELGAALKKLPADRQEQFKKQELKRGPTNRIEKLIADSPLNDEPIPQEQAERLAAYMKRLDVELADVSEEQLVAEIRALRQRPN